MIVWRRFSESWCVLPEDRKGLTDSCTGSRMPKVAAKLATGKEAILMRDEPAMTSGNVVLYLAHIDGRGGVRGVGDHRVGDHRRVASETIASSGHVSA